MRGFAAWGADRACGQGAHAFGMSRFSGGWIFGNDGGSLLILAENYNRPATGTTKTQSAQRTHKDVQRVILGPSPAGRSLRGRVPAAPGSLHAASSPRVPAGLVAAAREPAASGAGRACGDVVKAGRIAWQALVPGDERVDAGKARPIL
ncbi:MAG: hypothetical protein WAW52_12910 [Methanothrix sp.]